MPTSSEVFHGINGIPTISAERLTDGQMNGSSALTMEEEDAVLRETTGEFPDWVASFIRRVIVLFDNLPEEAGGETESLYLSVICPLSSSDISCSSTS